MSNFAFYQVFSMVLIVCYSDKMESVKLMDADLLGRTYEADARSKISREVKVKNLSPVGKTSIKQISTTKGPISLFNETDNPNTKQKLMVQAFIKSSNNLFESETQDDRSIELKETLESLNINSPLWKIPIKNNDKMHVNTAKERLEQFCKVKRYLIYNRLGTYSPLNHVTNELGGVRLDSERSVNRIYFPKERILRNRRSKFINTFDLAQRRHKPSSNLNKNHRSSNINRHFTRSHKRMYRKLGTPKKCKRSNLGKTATETIENLFGLSDSSEEELKNPPSYFFMNKMDQMKSGVKWVRKRQKQYDEEDCMNPMKRSRCRKIHTTTCRISLNDGKTPKICFPSTHRCLIAGSCPCFTCRATHPPRTTCESDNYHCCKMSTLGRCQGMDKQVSTQLMEDINSTKSYKKRCKKRCSCDCGCGCPSNLKRAHPDHALNRGSCGCECGCGCYHDQCGATGRPIS